jgi:hypothetical protein
MVRREIDKRTPLGSELDSLLRELDVSLAKDFHNKATGRNHVRPESPEMATAHHLASEAAWADRVEKQGYDTRRGHRPPPKF